ncbi:MAG TPA: porin, partial [Methylophilus sp.]
MAKPTLKWSSLILICVFQPVLAADLQPQTATEKSFDFFNDDAPFRADFSLGDHPSYVQVYGILDVALTHINHSLPANYELPNNFYPYSGAKVTDQVRARTHLVNGG